MHTNRRRFLATVSVLSLGAAGWMRAADAAGTANAFSPIRTKLAQGKDAVLFINGDSTSYEPNGPYFLFAKAIGEAMDCKVVLHRWGEWEMGKPTGPKQYEPPVTLRATGRATLTVYLATLPGASATEMFVNDRRAHAIDAIPLPDCCILHHGHNMLGAFQSLPGDRTSLRGWLFAAIGMTSMKWPGVPQVITNQNPWKRVDNYKRALESIQAVAALHPSLTLVDSHTAFITAGLTDDLYRNNDVIHPSDGPTNHKGAALVAAALMSTWNSAAADRTFSTPSWPAMPDKGLAGWAELPDWKNVEAARSPDGRTLEVTFRDPEASVGKIFSADEVAAISGKTISISALVNVPPKMRVAGSFHCKCEGEPRVFILRSGAFTNGTMLLVCAGIKVDADQGGMTVELKLSASLVPNEPFVGGPLLIRNVKITEGGLPKGIGV
ncbi:MAG: SGNH/GDSL hydrolase family protein [Verrucomicrobiaceae bacterium]|nr:MAG: SGNH/GDSL hydrolase family protein [Verrucomicrobiaceae bacterium]